MNIKPQTIMLAVRSLAFYSKHLEAKMDAPETDHDTAADIEQALVTYDLAAQDLKQAYAQIRETFDGYPPYEELIEDQ